MTDGLPENDPIPVVAPEAGGEPEEPGHAAAPPGPPQDVPEKFWDAAAGAVRTEALLKSYRELERKLGTMVGLPTGPEDAEGQARLREVLGVPERPEDYAIEPPHELLPADPALNQRLHEAGFTPAQAQLVYDLAAEHLLPLVDEVADELEATRQLEGLAARFGGREGWQTLSHQLKAWGEANLPRESYEALASSYEGVMALAELMRAREPSVLNSEGGAAHEPDEAELRSLMRDPRYWRDRDPNLVAKVTEGFRRLYPG